MTISLSAVQNESFQYFHSCHLHHRVYYELTMAYSLIDLISIMRVASDHRNAGQDSIPGQALIFFRFFFNRFSCLFKRKDHFHFQIFIRWSKYESFHKFPRGVLVDCSNGRSIFLGTTSRQIGVSQAKFMSCPKETGIFLWLL